MPTAPLIALRACPQRRGGGGVYLRETRVYVTYIYKSIIDRARNICDRRPRCAHDTVKEEDEFFRFYFVHIALRTVVYTIII